MNEKVKINDNGKIVDGKVVGRTFGGDIIETKNGERVWHGDKNNYVEDTLKTQQRKNEQAVAMQQAYPQHGIDFQPPKVGLLESLLGLAAASMFMAAILCIAVVAGIFFAMVTVWPQFIALLIGAFADGAISIPLIVFTAAILFLIYYLIHSIRKVTRTGKNMAKRYAIICIACIAVPYILLDLITIGFSLTAVLERLLYSIAFALLPTVILSCVEYKAKGGKQPLRIIAQTLCRGKGGIRFIFVCLGIVALILSVVFMQFMSSLGILSGIGAVIAFLLAGIFFILMGIKGKA